MYRFCQPAGSIKAEMHIKLLKENVYELQKQLTAANKRIAELIEQIEGKTTKSIRDSIDPRLI